MQLKCYQWTYMFGGKKSMQAKFSDLGPPLVFTVHPSPLPLSSCFGPPPSVHRNPPPHHTPSNPIYGIRHVSSKGDGTDKKFATLIKETFTNLMIMLHF